MFVYGLVSILTLCAVIAWLIVTAPFVVKRLTKKQTSDRHNKAVVKISKIMIGFVIVWIILTLIMM